MTIEKNPGPVCTDILKVSQLVSLNATSFTQSSGQSALGVPDGHSSGSTVTSDPSDFIKFISNKTHSGGKNMFLTIPCTENSDAFNILCLHASKFEHE